MQFGVAVNNLGGVTQSDLLVSLAQRVEALGYDSLWVSDHVVMPVEIESRYPYNSRGVLGISSEEDVLEPFTTLTFLAASTRRLRLGISVLVLPYRHPVLNAKMVATLDVLSGGRTILGTGVGWMKEEFDALDADYPHRGQVTDEHIKIFKALCTQDAPSFEGKYYRVKGIKFLPKPVQKPHPPVWVGGITPRAMHRAATLGDGWHVVRMRPHEVAQGRDVVHQVRREHGLKIDGFQISIRTTAEVTDTPLGDGRTPLTGTPEQILDDVRRYQEAGVEHIVLGPRAGGYEEAVRTVERFANDVIPKV